MTVATRTEALPREWPILLRHYAVTAVVAGAILWLAYVNGGYDATARATAGLAVWWTVVVAVGLGLWPLARPTAVAQLAGVLLAAFAAFTLASASWGDSAERAFVEFDRVALFLGVFAVAVLAGTRGNADRWCDGLAIAVAATALLALASRFVPSIFERPEYPEGLQDAALRLSYPLGYWNGLAIFLALGLPLLLRAGLSAESWLVRGLAVGMIPAVVAAAYLTSSRGGVVTILAVLALYLVATGRRFAVAGALAVAFAGSAGALSILLTRPVLADTPQLATTDDRVAAAAVIAVSCFLTALVHGAVTLLPRRDVRIPRTAAVVVGLLAVAVLATAVVAADPAERIATFTQNPEEAEGFEEEGFTRSHLVSAEGTGRWQFWMAAVDQFESAPVLGTGAGSYEAWWSQHGTFEYAIRDAHSLYLETLGELGIVGLALLVAFLLTVLVAGARRLLRAEAGERETLAALVAVGGAFVFALGLDWIWELTAVTAFGMVVLGLLVGPATAVERRPRGLTRSGAGRPERSGFAFAGVALIAAGWIALCAQGILLLAAVELRGSQRAAAAGDLNEALADARGARALEPWASTPRLQIALVEEQRGEVDAALASIREAVERDPSDWRLRLVAARIEAKAGLVEDARRSLAEAERLNPRSRLFQELRS